MAGRHKYLDLGELSEIVQDVRRQKIESKALAEWWEKAKDLPAPRLANPLTLTRTDIDVKTWYQRGKKCAPMA